VAPRHSLNGIPDSLPGTDEQRIDKIRGGEIGLANHPTQDFSAPQSAWTLDWKHRLPILIFGFIFVLVEKHFSTAAAAKGLAAFHEPAVLAYILVADGTLVEKNLFLTAPTLYAFLGHEGLLQDSPDTIKGAEGNPAFLIT